MHTFTIYLVKQACLLLVYAPLTPVNKFAKIKAKTDLHIACLYPYIHVLYVTETSHLSVILM